MILFSYSFDRSRQENRLVLSIICAGKRKACSLRLKLASFLRIWQLAFNIQQAEISQLYFRSTYPFERYAVLTRAV